MRLLTPLTAYAVGAFSRSITNLVAGFKERVLYIDPHGSLPPPCTADLTPLYQMAARVAELIPVTNPISAAQYVASKVGSKLRVYERALADLKARRPTLGSLARLSFFVKREATCHTKRQVPRVISPRAPGFNILLGRYLKPIEHAVYEALRNVAGSDVPVIAKGLTQQEKAGVIKHNMEKYGMCVGIDASRFDQHIRAELLDVEHAVYRAVYAGDAHLRALLREQLRVRGTGRAPDGRVRYSGPAMRCSGDVNTSLGNCLLTALLAMQFLKEHNIRGCFFADGDDCLLFMPRSALPRLVALAPWYRERGLTMKVEDPAFALEQVEFCQSRVVWDGAAYNLVRSPEKVLNTTGFVPYELTEHAYLCHLRAIGLCGLAMAAGVPILQPFYSKLVRDGRTGKHNARLLEGSGHQARVQMRKGHMAKCRPVTAEARASFAAAWGISPMEQIVIERELENIDVSRLASDNNLYIQSLPFVRKCGLEIPTL